MEVQIIDDSAPGHAIYQISQGAAQEQAVPPAFPPVCDALQQPEGQHARNRRGQGNEHIALPAPGAGQQAEGRPVIQQVDEVKNGITAWLAPKGN